MYHWATVRFAAVPKSESTHSGFSDSNVSATKSEFTHSSVSNSNVTHFVLPQHVGGEDGRRRDPDGRLEPGDAQGARGDCRNGHP